MCKCKQRINWQVMAMEDEFSNSMGYDGELLEDEDTSEWHAYCIVVQKQCSRCDDIELHDSLGGIWVRPQDRTRDVLTEMVLANGMIPKSVRHWDIDDYLA